MDPRGFAITRFIIIMELLQFLLLHITLSLNCSVGGGAGQILLLYLQ